MICKNYFIYFFISAIFAVFVSAADAQINNLQPLSSSRVTTDNQGRPVKQSTTNDSLTHRNPLEDSITISYHHFDSTRKLLLDSSVNDFYTRYPVPYYYADLGNFGNAAHSLLFNPYLKPGWDAGFHAFDIYRYTIGDTKFFQTTRPYTEMAYLLGGSGEQMANILHTQKRKSGVSFTFEYRFINSPGVLKNQNSNINNIRFNAAYQSDNKRYGLNFIFISNKIRSSENGGIVADSQLTSAAFNDPFSVTARLGNNNLNSRSPFNSTVLTGTTYSEGTVLIRQFYDFGQKDSLVTDSVTYKLFYPRIRLQHTFTFSKYSYSYNDNTAVDSDYQRYFNYTGNYFLYDTVRFRDRWLMFNNEFSIISFPEKNNLNQFLKLSAGLQSLSGAFDYTTYPVLNEKNIYASGEYRNRTRNQKWDVEANGLFYLTGNYVGDYSAYLSLQRQLSKKLGSLQIGLQDVNRTPSYVDDDPTSFPVDSTGNFKKENIARLFAVINMPEQHLTLTGSYYAFTNYVYFDSFLSSKQYSSLFNVLHVELDKKIPLARHWNWYTEIHLQKTTGNPPVSLPLIVTRNRIAFEGNFYTNLFLSTGIEAVYYSNYHADNYSPLTGQFFYQNSFTTSNRPNINLFLDFRIKSFKAFLRLENLNSLNKTANGLGFTYYNFSAPDYPARTLWIRLGIWWNFVN